MALLPTVDLRNRVQATEPLDIRLEVQIEDDLGPEIAREAAFRRTPVMKLSTELLDLVGQESVTQLRVPADAEPGTDVVAAHFENIRKVGVDLPRETDFHRARVMGGDAQIVMNHAVHAPAQAEQDMAGGNRPERVSDRRILEFPACGGSPDA